MFSLVEPAEPLGEAVSRPVSVRGLDAVSLGLARSTSEHVARLPKKFESVDKSHVYRRVDWKLQVCSYSETLPAPL